MSAGSGSLGASQKGSRTGAAVRLGLEGILKTGGERRFEMVATFMGLEDASGVALRVHRRLVAGVFLLQPRSAARMHAWSRRSVGFNQSCGFAKKRERERNVRLP